MHAKVFDTIFQATFEAIALRALAVVAVLLTLHLIDSLVNRIVSSRGKVSPRFMKTSRRVVAKDLGGQQGGIPC